MFLSTLYLSISRSIDGGRAFSTLEIWSRVYQSRVFSVPDARSYINEIPACIAYDCDRRSHRHPAIASSYHSVGQQKRNSDARNRY